MRTNAQNAEHRGATRVSYRSLARLTLQPSGQDFEAEIHNLSASGMFVIAEQVPATGSPVDCHVFLGTEPWVLHGKIAWVRPDWRPNGTRAPAAGIEFVDLSPRDTEALSRVVGESRPDPEDVLDTVEVTFEGLPSAVSARAKIGTNGLVIATKLPFMRMGSEVRIAFEKDGKTSTRLGRLQGVSLGPSSNDDVPRLLVEVSTDETQQGEMRARAGLPGMAPAALVHPVHDPDSLPLPRRSITPAPVPGLEKGAAFRLETKPWGASASEWSEPVIEDAIEAGPKASARALVAPPPPMAARSMATKPLFAPEIESTADDSEPPATSPDGLSASGEIVLPDILLLDEPSPSNESSQPFETASMPRDSSAAVRGEVPSLPDLESITAPVGRNVSSGKRMVSILSIAAPVVVIMGIVVGTLMGSSRAGHQGERQESLAEQMASNPRVQPLDGPGFSGVARSEGIVPGTAPTVDTATARTIELPAWPFTIDVSEHTTSVWVPVRGSTEGGLAYRLAGPIGGLAANLPAATIGDVDAKAGHYEVNESGVRQVWVEQREGGMHLRVLTAGAVTRSDAKVEATGVRFTLERR